MSNKLSSKRLGKIIENDRLTVSADVSGMIEYDLKNLLENYFNLTGKVTLSVTALTNCYLITVTTTASSVKPFGVIK